MHTPFSHHILNAPLKKTTIQIQTYLGNDFSLVCVEGTVQLVGDPAVGPAVLQVTLDGPPVPLPRSYRSDKVDFELGLGRVCSFGSVPIHNTIQMWILVPAEVKFKLPIWI